ncbi:trypsin, alkaline C [Octopus sinensis]|uniref:Trypsin, alkaline C n=1 Tax=Octopus sinensis TaxID=2607531 RepID=A0A6P7TP94_9MOLL|nr:trypsin, alkaline C [Octopus sinensis]
MILPTRLPIKTSLFITIASFQLFSMNNLTSRIIMLSLCCLLVAVASVFAGPETQIVEGTTAADCELPSIVYLILVESATSIKDCGGTLIDSTHILTAAHCVRGISQIYAAYGVNNVRTIERKSVKAVSNVVVHEGYINVRSTIKNDIAILTLNESLSEGRCVKFAPMANQGENFGTSRCIAAGWGDLTYRGKGSENLQKVALPIVPYDECKKKSILTISDGILCAGDFEKGGPSTCEGDSGGPLYCPRSNGQMVLAGITSFGYNCKMEISAFSDVGYFRNWIDSHL